MKKFLVLFAVLALISIACGGGGGGHKSIFDSSLQIASADQLGSSELAAIRDMGFYDYDGGVVQEPAVKSVPSTTLKIIGLTAKEAINDSGTETVYGEDGKGKSTMDYTINGDVGDDSGHATLDFTITAADFYALGKCSQLVHFSGVQKCHADISVNSDADMDADGYCYTEGPVSFTGADGVTLNVLFEYEMKINGNLNSESSLSVEYTGVVNIGEFAIRIEELVTPLACTNPSVSTVVPESSASDISVDSTVSLTFDVDVNQSSVEEGFHLIFNGEDDYGYCSTYVGTSTEDVDGTKTWDGNTMTFTPSLPLEYSSCYVVQVDDDVVSPMGDPLSDPVEMSFSTEDDPLS